MIPASAHIKEMLIADINVDTDNYPVYIGIQPADPINCITLWDYSALPPELLLDNAEVATYEYPSIHFRVRATHYLEGWNLIESIKTSLHGRANIAWNGVFYALIKVISGPMFLHQDDNQRIHFTMSVDVRRIEC